MSGPPQRRINGRMVALLLAIVAAQILSYVQIQNARAEAVQLRKDLNELRDSTQRLADATARSVNALRMPDEIEDLDTRLDLIEDKLDRSSGMTQEDIQNRIDRLTRTPAP